MPRGVNAWVVVVGARQYEEERLYRRDRVALPDAAGPVPGDLAVLVADAQPPVVFGWGRVTGSRDVVYDRRLFDAPVPAGDLAAGPLDAGRFAQIEKAAGEPRRRGTWLVSVDLPVEAETPGEAVRQFWSYLRELGPRELPAFVAPLGDELAMQAYVLGEETNLDPEED
jgi:hypothetical protein